MNPPEQVDVVVIGAGVVGAAIARELAGLQLRIALVDARDDVGDGTSKANTAILHTGFDARPGTLESRLVRRGYALLTDYASATGIPVERTGALLVAWTDAECAVLPQLQDKARRNGYERCEIVTADEVYRRVPALGPGALAGLTVPDESITCTWTTTLALATDALHRGVRLHLGWPVHDVDVDVDAQCSTLRTTDGRTLTTRWIVNAAGLGADGIDDLLGYRRFSVTPRRGELLVYDKMARALAPTIVLPVPSAVGKGVLISPTIYGNVMLGPTAQDLTDREDTATSADGFDFLLGKGGALMPRLLAEEVTASYAGLRAAIDASDYLLDVDAAQRYVLVGGIRSTGLTASMAIAEYVREQLAPMLAAPPREDLPPAPRMPNIGEAFTRPYQDAARIAADPAYGTIVCFCERVSAGEIRDALNAAIPAHDRSGLGRRTRAGNGRCQGFYCGAQLGSLLEPAAAPAPAVGPAAAPPAAAPPAAARNGAPR